MERNRVEVGLRAGRERVRNTQAQAAARIGERLGIGIPAQSVGQRERGESLPDGRDKLVAHLLVL